MQKQLEKYDPSYSKQFQASAKLHNSLSKE